MEKTKKVVFLESAYSLLLYIMMDDNFEEDSIFVYHGKSINEVFEHSKVNVETIYIPREEYINVTEVKNLFKRKIAKKKYKKYLKEIFRLGLPIGVQSVLYPISNTIIQSSINTFGVNSIAAWAISGKLDFLIWTVSDAFSIAISTFVAQNYGAEKHQRARNGIKAALIMSMVTIFVISSILYLYNKPLAYFLIDDKNIVDLTSKIIKLIAPLYFIYVIGDVLSGAIRGIGDTFNPMIINIFGICVCRVLWIFFIVPLNPTFFMVLYGFIVSWIITAIMYITYIVYKRKSF